MVKQPGSSFIANATMVWEEMFTRGESEWPDVIFMVAGLGTAGFRFEPHVQAFVQNLPPSWTGTLVIDDFEFSARPDTFPDFAGLGHSGRYRKYLNKIIDFASQLNDPRVRWLDSIGISKEQRMYAQNGEAHVSSSQHFHGFCRENDLSDPSRTMNVCSNITEMVGQLLLGHALGPKDEFLEQIKQAPKPGKQRATWCHHCPKCMLPFHIQSYPEMQCVEGPQRRRKKMWTVRP